MSVIADSMDPANSFANSFLDLSGAGPNTIMDMDIDLESQSVMVDPQLTMMYPGQLRTKQEPFTMDPSAFWDPELDSSMPLFEGIIQPTDDAPMVGVAENPEPPVSPSSSVANSSSRRTSKASRNSSKSSVPSLASVSTQPKKRTRKPSRKKQEQTKTQPQPIVKEESVSGAEDDPKRTKYLERNRVAASKCRQKKKEWVHELEDTKTELEAKNNELQRQYNDLLDEVTQMKNHLMGHASCSDPNIDQWIEIEARKFVQKTTTRDSDERLHRFSLSHSTSASASRRPSLAGEWRPS